MTTTFADPTREVPYPIPSVEQLLTGPEDRSDPEWWARVRDDILSAYAESTKRWQGSGRESLAAFAKGFPLPWSPAAALQYYYLVAHRTSSKGSLRLAELSVRLVHAYYELPDPSDHPFVHRYLTLRRRRTARPHPKDAFMGADLTAALRNCEHDPYPQRGERDAVLLCCSFFSAARPGESAHLLPQRVKFAANGMWLDFGPTKMDQLGDSPPIWVGAAKDPHYCPVRRLKRFLKKYKCTVLFPRLNRQNEILPHKSLTREGISFIIKRHAEALGYDRRRYGGHSTRAGFVTTGVAENVSSSTLRRVTRQAKSTFEHYVRTQQIPFNATRALGF